MARCNKCGTETDSNFCPNCGAQIMAEQPVQSPTPFTQPGNAQPEKAKKPITKKWWFWAIIAVVVIGALGSDSTKDKKPSVTDEPQSTTAPAQAQTPPAVEAVAEPEAAPETAQSSDVVFTDDMVTSIIEASFNGNDSFDRVEIKDGMCIIYVNAPSGSVMELLGKNEETLSAWDGLVDTMSDVSAQMGDTLVNTCNRSDLTCSIFIVSDVNPDNILLCVTNGAVIYNVVDDV